MPDLSDTSNTNSLLHPRRESGNVAKCSKIGVHHVYHVEHVDFHNSLCDNALGCKWLRAKNLRKPVLMVS